MSGYSVEIRPMVWRIEAGSYYAFVLAKTPGSAARKIRAARRRGLLGADFDEIESVRGPWERNPRHVLVAE